MIKLGKDEKFILEKLQESGDAYICGGKVRDNLLGIDSKDTDFVTTIPYEWILQDFKEFSPKEVGKAFGVVLININGVDYEIAKARVESNHTSNRKEFDVKFTGNIRADIHRRDFTICGMLFDGNEVIDYVGGKDDLKNKIVRFIGEPTSRISEDSLRLMRAIRFATKLNFSIEKESMQAIKDFSYLIRDISKERVRMELDKILMTNYPKRGMELLHELSILKHIIPELEECFGFEQNNPHHDKDLANHILVALQNTDKDLITRLATLFHDIGKVDTYTVDENGIAHFYGHEKRSAEITESIMKDLKYDNGTIDSVCRLIANHMNKSQKISDKSVKKFINRVGEDNLHRIFELMRADIIAHKPPHNFESLENLKIRCKTILKNNEPTTRFDLDINGNDIMKEFNLKPCKKVGDMLKWCMDKVLDDPELNDINELIKLLREWYA